MLYNPRKNSKNFALNFIANINNLSVTQHFIFIYFFNELITFLNYKSLGMLKTTFNFF